MTRSGQLKIHDAQIAIALARSRAAAGGGGAITVAAPGFVQPAVGAAVSIPVSSSDGANAPGAFLAVTLAGVANFYRIQSVPDGTHLVAVNLGGTNAAPATAFPAGSPVVPDAPASLANAGPMSVDAPGFVQPAVGAPVSIPVTPSSAGANAPGAFLAVTLAGVANFYRIQSVPDGTHLVAVNLGGTNAAPATAFPAGSPVVPDAPASLVNAGPLTVAVPGFVQPAVGLPVSIPVNPSTALANAPGAALAVTLAGAANFYSIQSIPDASHVIAVNLGGANAPPTTAFAAGLSISTDGPPSVPLQWFNVMQFGAVGDDVHDDTAAILAADAAAKSAPIANGRQGRVYFPGPPVAYRIQGELLINWPTHWAGDTSNIDQTILRAHGGMRSMLPLRTTFGLPSDGSDGSGRARATFENLTFDANFGGADVVLLEIGAEFTCFTACRFENALHAGVVAANQVLAPGLSAVTQTGGGPAMTLVQVDPNYSGFPDFILPTHAFARVVVGGPLGTATIQLSLDGGATYLPGTQVARSTINLVINDGTGVATILTGLQAHFAAGVPLVPGTTYDFVHTPTIADLSTSLAINGDIEYHDCAIVSCGTIQATADQAPKYNGDMTTVVVPGTFTTTALSPTIVGAGTTLLSGVGAATSRVALNLQPGDKTYPGIIVDDVTFVAAPGTAPKTSAGGLTFAWAGFGGAYESTNCGDTAAALWVSGVYSRNCIGFQQAGNKGALFLRPQLTSAGLAGFVFGGGGNDAASGTTLVRPLLDSGVHLCFVFTPGSSGRIIEPGAKTQDGFSAQWLIDDKGLTSGAFNYTGGSYIPNKALVLSFSDQTIVAAGQTLLLPDGSASSNTGHTSFIQFDMVADFLMTGQLLPDPGVAGLIVCLHNQSAFTMTLQPNIMTGVTGLRLEGQYLPISPGEMIWLMCTDPGTAAPWTQMDHNLSIYGGVGGGNHAGNTGQDKRVVRTTASVVPVEIYRVDVQNSLVAAGTGLKFDLFAQSVAGTNWALWSDCTIGYDTNGNTPGLTIGRAQGSAGGAVPLGWDLTVDPSGTVPFSHFFFTGDASANQVTAVLTATHRDGCV
jgi:hypothetical protein